MLNSPHGDRDSKNELGYDLKDDLICFMRNDPQFYRKDYFPVINKFVEYIKDGKNVQSRAFESLVVKAYEQYQKKFPVEGLEPSLKKEMCEEICNEIHTSECEFIKQGLYDEK